MQKDGGSGRSQVWCFFRTRQLFPKSTGAVIFLLMEKVLRVFTFGYVPHARNIQEVGLEFRL